MLPLRSLPELVQDSELEVTIRDNITIHTRPLECRDDFAPQVWETKRVIGHGGDGTVFLQRKIKGPGAMDMIAVKQMRLNAGLASEDHDSKRYVRELEALAKFAQGKYSRHFVRSYGWYQEAGWLYICMEYCRHLDLGEYLKTHRKLPEKYARIIALQVLQGLVQMHTNKIAHRDLKPGNILIHRKRPEDDAWWVVLGDLGLSRRSGTSSGTTTIRGTPSFMAPETIGKPFLGNPSDADPFSADMWCLGETISCALTGHATFSNGQLFEYQTRRTGFPDGALKESLASVDAIDFIRSLMDTNPSRRLTAMQALNHPWIKASHASHAYTPNTTAPNTLPSRGKRLPTSPKSSDNKPSQFDDRRTLGVNQTTQASAQWTQTSPVHWNGTKSSASLTAAVENPGMQRNIPLLNQPAPLAQLVERPSSRRAGDHVLVDDELNPQMHDMVAPGTWEREMEAIRSPISYPRAEALLNGEPGSHHHRRHSRLSEAQSTENSGIVERHRQNREQQAKDRSKENRKSQAIVKLRDELIAWMRSR